MNHNTVIMWMQPHSSANIEILAHHQNQIAIILVKEESLFTKTTSLPKRNEYLFQNKVQQGKVN